MTANHPLNDSETETLFDQWGTMFSDLNQREANPVVKDEDIPWEDCRQGPIKWYSLPVMDRAVLPEWMHHKERIIDSSGRHTHQGGNVMIITKGKGATEIEGEVYEWEKGDLICLPIKPGGVTHQHFNRNEPDNPAEWIAFVPIPHLKRMASKVTQLTSFENWENTDAGERGLPDDDTDRVSEEFADFSYDDWLDYEPPEETDTLYEDLVVRRNEYRKELAKSRDVGNWGVLKGDVPDWEWNPQGRMKWYLHPSYDDRAVRNLLLAMQKIPGGSRSGKQRRQGGILHHILEGSGYTVIDGEHHDWEAGDYVGIPRKPAGVEIQHFNANEDEPARFMVAETTAFLSLGVDMGSGFQQLESCPEYE